MRKIKYLLFLSVIAMVLSYTSVCFAEQEVLRWTKEGKYENEEKDQDVLSEDAYSITYKGLGKQPRGDIIYVYHKTNPSFNRAEESFFNGEYRGAIELYKKALESGKEGWIKSYCLFRIGQCYWYMGGASNRKSAISYFEKLLKEVPDTPFLGEASCLLCEIYTFEKKYDKAENVVNPIIRNRQLQTCWRENAQLKLAQLLLAKKEYRKAASSFKSLSTRLTYVTLKQMAQFGLGECMEADGLSNKDASKFKDAIKVYEKIESTYNESTLCKAWTSISRCYYNIKDYEQSYQYGLRAGLMFINRDRQMAAMGLYYAGMAMLALYNGTKDAELRSFYGSNIKLIRRLFNSKQLFGTTYAIKGLDELK